MPLIKYEELTPFQTWFFFYIVKEKFARLDLQGVMPKMCITVRMKIDVDNYENDTKKLIDEARILVDNGLMEISTVRIAEGEYVLTDKGELYILQKILRPLFEIKDKGKTTELGNYLKGKDGDTIERVGMLLEKMETTNPQKSISEISELVLSRAMPFISALNSVHACAKGLGLF